MSFILTWKIDALLGQDIYFFPSKPCYAKKGFNHKAMFIIKHQSNQPVFPGIFFGKGDLLFLCVQVSVQPGIEHFVQNPGKGGAGRDPDPDQVFAPDPGFYVPVVGIEIGNGLANGLIFCQRHHVEDKFGIEPDQCPVQFLPGNRMAGLDEPEPVFRLVPFFQQQVRSPAGIISRSQICSHTLKGTPVEQGHEVYGPPGV
jgi:hypothetical protein